VSDDVGAQIARLFEKVAHLEGLIERMHRPGTVTDVDYSDATKPRARIQIGTDEQGQPVKGPWVPIASVAGARTIHAPVSVGQQMLHISPDGNFENGVLLPYAFSKPIPSPSTDPKTHMDVLGKTKNTMTDGTWKQEVENASVTLTKGKIVLVGGNSTVTIEDGKVTFDAKQVLFGKNAVKPVSMQGTGDSRGDVDVGPFSAVMVTE
jgi:phage baseplate assembly protein gpV